LSYTRVGQAAVYALACPARNARAGRKWPESVRPSPKNTVCE